MLTMLVAVPVGSETFQGNVDERTDDSQGKSIGDDPRKYQGSMTTWLSQKADFTVYR